MERLEGWTGLLVLRLLGVVLLGTVVVVLVHPSDPNIDYDRRLVLVGLAASMAVAAAGPWLLRRVSARVRRGTRVRPSIARWRGWTWVAACILSAAAAALTGWLGWLLRYRYGWDAGVLAGYSRELTSGAPLSDAAAFYLSRYPNNVTLLALMNLTASAGGAHGLSMAEAFLVLNAACSGVTVLLTFVLVRMLRGVRAAFAAQVLVVLLLSASPWSAVSYSDLPAVPLVLGAVVLACAALRSSRWAARALLVAGAFATAAAAYLLKTTPATTAVALTGVGIVIAIGAPWRRAVVTLLLVALGLATFAVVAVGASPFVHRTAMVPTERLDLEHTPPPTWWLANGLMTTDLPGPRHYYGSYSSQLVRDSWYLRGQQLQDLAERRLDEQVSELGGGIVAFEVKKQAFVWGDGMFFAWGEGYDSLPDRLEDRSDVARDVQQLQHPAGSWYVVRSSLTNGVWLFVLLWAGVGLLRARYRRETLLLALTVLGIMVFELLFQARSRYLIPYVPVVVALAAAVDPRDLLRGARPRTPTRTPAQAPPGVAPPRGG